jgi:hypothetical protein
LGSAILTGSVFSFFSAVSLQMRAFLDAVKEAFWLPHLLLVDESSWLFLTFFLFRVL